MIVKTRTNNRLGETNISNSGQKMTIIAYRGVNDIDILFEDGTILTHKKYHSFKAGKIKNPNYEKRIGETNIAKNGQKMTIIAYRHNTDIDILFEDGTIVTNKYYANFKRGTIKNPSISKSITRIGETRLMNNGQKATIICHRTANDLDVRFEDGTIVKHKGYREFTKGSIENPLINKTTMLTAKRIGETRRMNDGQKATIICYRHAGDIDVKFEDGTVVKHKPYASFTKGSIKNTTRVYMTRNGMPVTIIKRGCSLKNDPVTVQFEDGIIVKNVRYHNLLRGHINHPLRPLQELPQTIDGMIITEIAYKSKNPNMFCECIHCHEKFIMTYDEMKEHTCKPNK